MHEKLIPLSAAWPLLGLGPCLFIVAFVLLASRHRLLSVVPALYFLSLSASFMLPFVQSGWGRSHSLRSGLIFTQSLTPALCYLLIRQLIDHKLPRPVYWLILAVPVCGVGAIVYGSQSLDEICFRTYGCMTTESLLILYRIFAAALIFLLLVVQISPRLHAPGDAWRSASVHRRHAYWLIIALIALSLAVPFLYLMQLADVLSPRSVESLAMLIRLGFIYLVLTSLFRVYGEGIELEVESLPTLLPGRKPADEAKLAERLERLMQDEAPYRQPSLSRDELARKAGMSEQALSRIVNQRYGQNVSDFLNDFRILEAKEKLRAGSEAVNQIAYGVGFNSIASFNRVFRQKTGMSPTAYRDSVVSAVGSAGAP